MPAAAATRTTAPLDELTLRRAARGDERAWRDLVARYQQPIHSLIWRLLAGRARHRVEDLVQETFVRVLRALPGWNPAGPASLSTWMLTIVRRAPFPSTTRGGSFGYSYTFSRCDADALRQKGDDHLQTGMDKAALAAFEASYQCRADESLHRRMFLAACRSKNHGKAKLYYPKLKSNEATSLSQMCFRNGVDPTSPASAKTAANHVAGCQHPNFYDPMNAEPMCSATGVIKISSKPAGAKIHLDGVDTGKTTPATIESLIGRHRVTFELGDNKYTFGVQVKEGETVTLSKTFE